MEPKTSRQHRTVGPLGEDELGLDESLDALEVEDLLGHQVDLDEQEDWRAIDL